MTLLKLIIVFFLVQCFFKTESILEKFYYKKVQKKEILLQEKTSLRIFKIILQFLIFFSSIEEILSGKLLPPINIIPAIVCIASIIVGITLRILAIRELGIYWSYNIEILRNHKLIKSGIYRYLSHPAYWGNIFIPAFFCLVGVSYTTFLSLIFISFFGYWRSHLECCLLKNNSC